MRELVATGRPRAKVVGTGPLPLEGPSPLKQGVTSPTRTHGKPSPAKLPATTHKPLLLVDVDGVISLWGFALDERPAGTFRMVDGIGHFLSAEAGEHLRALGDAFELVWCTGWEERANDHLVEALELPGSLPYLSFDEMPQTRAHWKLGAIGAHVGEERPVAWIDDAHDEACAAWARARPGPTLLLTTHPAHGLTAAHAAELDAWAATLAGRPHGRAGARPS